MCVCAYSNPSSPPLNVFFGDTYSVVQLCKSHQSLGLFGGEKKRNFKIKNESMLQYTQKVTGMLSTGWEKSFLFKDVVRGCPQALLGACCAQRGWRVEVRQCLHWLFLRGLKLVVFLGFHVVLKGLINGKLIGNFKKHLIPGFYTACSAKLLTETNTL